MDDSPFHPLFELTETNLHYFSVLGRALYTAQRLEMNCCSLLTRCNLEDMLGKGWNSKRPEWTELLQKIDKKTLGNMVRETGLRNLRHNSIDFEKLIDDAVGARNTIAHSITVGVTDRIDSEVEERISHIAELVRLIAKADYFVAAFDNKVWDGPYHYRGPLEEYEKMVVDWVLEKYD